MTKRVIHRFSKEEDDIITEEVSKNGDDIHKALEVLEQKFGENHSRRSIIERYKGFLSQNREGWTKEEDQIIMDSFEIHRNRWTLIAKFLDCRSGDQVKIRYKQLVKAKKDRNKPEKKSKAKSPPKSKPKRPENPPPPVPPPENTQNQINPSIWSHVMNEYEMALEDNVSIFI